MKILVTYATRHGATRGIAERIAFTLRDAGLDADLQPAEILDDVSTWDAFIVGGAAYAGHWLKEATEFVRRHHDVLVAHPTWLFSDGPVGTDKIDSKGRDVIEASIPDEFPEFKESIRPRDEKIFFGAWDPFSEPTGFAEKLLSKFPASWKAQMPAGDFRDWPAIEGWARDIARELGGTPAEPVPA